MRQPRLTIFTKTLDGAANLARVLPHYREVADELVVAVDSATRDDSREVASQFADCVFTFPHGCAIGGGDKPRSLFFEHLFPHCSGDWILQLDHDETLSPHWSDRTFVDSLLSNRFITHVFLPRRWALPGGTQYIASRHWYPNFMMRLFRNLPSLLHIHEDLHGSNQVAGEAHYEADASIIHWLLDWTSRQERLARVAEYAKRSDYSAHEFYLHEHQPFTAHPLLESHSEPDFKPAFPLSSDPRFRAAIQVSHAPQTIFAGDTEGSLIAIHNGSDRVLKPDSAMVRTFGFRICQWWQPLSGGTVDQPFEGERWPLPRRIHPGETALAWIRLQAPSLPGRYRIRLDLIEEGVTWFSSHVEMPVISTEILPRPADEVWYPDFARRATA